MFGGDSCGRKVSLLNASPTLTTTTTTSTTYPKPIFNYPKLSKRSRPTTLSISSSGTREGDRSSRSSSSGSPQQSHSPPTPPLVRLDSQSSLTLSTPSPMIPQYGFEPMDQQLKREQNAHPYYGQHFNGRAPNQYPSMQDQTPQPYYNFSSQQPLPSMNDYELNQAAYDIHNRTTLQPHQTQLQNHTFSENPSLTQNSLQKYQPSTTALPPLSSGTSPSSGVTIKTDPTTPITTSNNAAPASATKTPGAKKKYPCPHAARFSCPDTFTTSGHAARHGKKHTGEKNILCPTCNKAFTRKDNMKQHERTHKGGSRTGSTAASPVIGNKGASRKASLADTDAMSMSSDGLPEPSTMSKRPKLPRSELSEIIEGITQGKRSEGHHDGDMDADGEGESPGLDALATAASEMA